MIDKWREFQRRLDAANADSRLREFRELAHRTGLVEAYHANWHARGVFSEKLHVRVDRYRDRCEITAEVLGQTENGTWEAVRTQTRLLSLSEWEQVSKWNETCLWGLPTRDGADAVMDGDCWRIEGFRNDEYHEVYRHTGSLVEGGVDEVYELGKRLATLAGLRRFAEPDHP